jgi:hypothetical protein
VRDRVPLLLGSIFVARGIRDRGRSDVVTVTGSAKQRITSDYVVWDSSLSEQQPTAEASAKLVAGGIPVQVNPVQYVYTRLADIRPALLAAAVRDATNRGRVLLRAGGAKLGGLRGVNVGVFQVTAPNSTEVSDYGVYDTSTLRKDVTAVVNVTFALG